MQKKIGKILFFTLDFPPMQGGMARHSYDTVKALKLAGYLPVVITLDKSRAEYCFLEPIDCLVIRLKGLTPDNIFNNYLFNLIRFFVRGVYLMIVYRPRAILANSWAMSGISAFLLSKFFGLPYFVFAHGLDVYQPRSSKKAIAIMKLVLRNAKRVIAISNFTKGLLKDIIEEDKIEVINPVVDFKRFSETPGTPLNKFSGKRVILTVARLVESKGQDSVIRAMPEVIKVFPEAVYCIVGAGPCLDQLKKLAVNLNVNDNVLFEGSVPDSDVAAYYYACDVFIMASRQISGRGEVEGFGIAFLEAGACAKPAIGSKSGGISEAIQDAVTGILVDPDDSKAIALKTIQLLSDNALAKKLGEKAKERVVSQFSLERFGKKLKYILNNELE